MTAQLLRIPEVAQRLGCGRTKVYELINQGHLATVTVGSVTRVSEAAIDAYVDSQTTHARKHKRAS